jgi:hypothetical protein
VTWLGRSRWNFGSPSQGFCIFLRIQIYLGVEATGRFRPVVPGPRCNGIPGYALRGICDGGYDSSGDPARFFRAPSPLLPGEPACTYRAWSSCRLFLKAAAPRRISA